MNPFGVKAPSITFFFPYKEVSGVPVLFARMARHLAEFYGREISVVDYSDGYMAQTLRNDPRVHLQEFTTGTPFSIEADTILVMQSILPYTIRRELQINSNTPMLFWTLHPLNWVPTIIPFQWARHFQGKHVALNQWVMRKLMASKRKELDQLLHNLVDKKSVLFMDGASFRSTCDRLGLTLESPSFIPVPCEVPSLRRKVTPSIGRTELSFAWLGRVGDFKTHILAYSLRKLSDYAQKTRTPMAFHIIGNGPDVHRIKQLNVEHRFFRIIWSGTLIGEPLDNYLLEHIDMLWAMGTSALEGGKLGIPSILLDLAYGPVPEGYRFRWLFESPEYGLGELIGTTNYEANNRSLEIAIESVQSNYEDLSERTYQYCMQHHSIESVAELFLDAASKASFQYGDFKPNVLERGITRKGYELLRRVVNNGG